MGNAVENNSNGKSTFTVESVQKKEFKSMMSTTLIEYVEMAEMVNEYFRQIFKDYVGCKPLYLEGQRVSVLLSFAPGANNSCGAVAAVDEISRVNAASGNNIIANYINSDLDRHTTGGERFTLSPAAKDILRKYIISLPGSKDINWGAITGQHVSGGYQNSVISYRVTNIDMNLLVKDIFNSDGKKYAYDVHIMKNALDGFNAHNSKMFEITRADEVVVGETNAKYFAYPLGGVDDFIIKG